LDPHRVWPAPQEIVLNGSTPATPTNRLLSVLPAAQRRQFIAHCEPIELVLGEVLVAAGGKVRYVYFPTGSFISMFAALADGTRLEVGLVGNEGMLGTELILGIDVAPLQAMVQGAGATLRMSAARFRTELDDSPLLQRRLKRYVYVLMKQLSQTAICTRYHFVAARLARLLLMTRDRAHSDRFHVTQEFMAFMLGVRRVAVSKAAGMLEGLGLIRYNRGAVHIIDATGLENAACECYGQANDVYEQTLLSAVGRSRGRVNRPRKH
jgi:CRP-like cAMP-binding protein